MPDSSYNAHPERLDRRRALRWFAAAAAAGVAHSHAPGMRAQEATEPEAALEIPPSKPTGSLSDPDLLNPTLPWERTLDATELETAAALCDLILPEDGQSPAASALHIPDFLDEWVSAPFPIQTADSELIRGGLGWINTEAHRRFTAIFSDLTIEQQQAICDDIAYAPEAAPEFHFAARFFDRFRELAATGYYTSSAGWQDLRYIGNIPLPRFDGPPPEVLQYLGLEND